MATDITHLNFEIIQSTFHLTEKIQDRTTEIKCIILRACLKNKAKYYSQIPLATYLPFSVPVRSRRQRNPLFTI